MYQVNILDISGNIRKQYKYAGGVRNTVISLSGLSHGIYTLKAFDGKYWSDGIQVVKQ